MNTARLDGLFGTLFRTMQRRNRALATVVMGDDGTIDAGDGLVWAMVQLRDGQTLTRVRCSRAKPFPGATYTVAPNPTDGVWEVLNPDPVTVRAFFNGLPDPESALNTPAHAWTHRGVVNLDPLLVEPQQILGLQVRPADSGVAVVVSAYPPFGFGETLLDLTSVLPTGGLQQLVVVCYDTTAGSLVAVSGATAPIPGWPYVSGSPGAAPFTQADIDVAPVARHHRRLAAVRVYQGQTRVVWSDVFADLRDFIDGRPGWLRLDGDDPTLGGLAEKLAAGSGVTLSRQAGDVLVVSAAAAGGYWDVDAPPETPSALDDEFDDASLDGQWAEYDYGAIQTPSEASDVLTLSQPSQTSATLSGLTQPLPAGDFTIAIRLKLDHDTVSGGSAALEAGILLCEDASDSAGNALLAGLTVGESIGARFGWSKWTAYDARQSAYYQNVPPSTWTAGTYVYLRLRRSGSTLFFDHSDDGQSWVNKDLTTYLAFTPGDVGVGLYNYASGITLVMDVDFFRYRAVCDPLEEPVHGATTASVGDHGALTGLADDDHLQYHTDGRGDARYFQQTEFLDESAGAGDAGKPVVLNANGELDSSLLPLTVHMALWAFVGDVAVGSSPLRIYNATGQPKTLHKVFLACNTPPTGADLVVDVHKGGVTIFTTQANRPAITAGDSTGSSTALDVTDWDADEYLTVDVDQVGGTVAGADLTVHVVYS